MRISDYPHNRVQQSNISCCIYEMTSSDNPGDPKSRSRQSSGGMTGMTGMIEAFARTFEYDSRLSPNAFAKRFRCGSHRRLSKKAHGDQGGKENAQSHV